MNVVSSLRRLLRRRNFESELAEEMRGHLEQRTAEYMATGLSAEEARQAALRRFGGVAQVQEECRDSRPARWADQLSRDVRQAVRSLWRAPLFTCGVVLTLALCLGPNAAIFSLVDSILLQPLPFHQPQELVRVTNVAEKNGGQVNASSIPQWKDFQAQADLFSGFALYRSLGFTLDDGGGIPMRPIGLMVSYNFFDMLGIKPVLGRFFRPEEEGRVSAKVIVLSYSLWKSSYGGDPSVIGRTVRGGGDSHTIIGVAPPSAETLDAQAKLFFLQNHDGWRAESRARYIYGPTLVGRLRPGVALQAGLAQLQSIERVFYDTVATPDMRVFLDRIGHRLAAEPLVGPRPATLPRHLWMLQGGALLVLVVGCVNVVSLLLARANAKATEHAIRHALGASRGDLLRQLFVESLLLTGLGLALSLSAAWGLLVVVNHFLPVIAPGVPPVSLGADVVLTSMIVGGAISFVFALIPAGPLHARGLGLANARGGSASRFTRVVGKSLVASQISLALILLVAAGLLIHSFVRVMQVDPGFEPSKLIQGRIALHGYASLEANAAVQSKVLEEIKAIPGVEKVCFVTAMGIAAAFRATPFVLRRDGVRPEAELPQVHFQGVTADFFDTMGLRLLEGEVFAPSADFRTSRHAVVDTEFVKRYLGGRNPVGEELSYGPLPPGDGMWFRIIGVVSRAKVTGLDQEGLPFVYIPVATQTSGGVSIVIRSQRAAAGVLADVRVKLRAIDPRIPLYSTGTFEGAIDDMLTYRRGMMMLLAGFAGLALVLAAVGIYGMLAYDVTQRTREIGIRSAIGATRAQILGLVMRQGMGLAALGLAVGLLGSLYFSRFLQGQLFNLHPFDPVVYIGVIATLVVICVLACWIPARRAARVDPMVALRAE